MPPKPRRQRADTSGSTGKTSSVETTVAVTNQGHNTATQLQENQLPVINEVSQVNSETLLYLQSKTGMIDKLIEEHLPGTEMIQWGDIAPIKGGDGLSLQSDNNHVRKIFIGQRGGAFYKNKNGGRVYIK